MEPLCAAHRGFSRRPAICSAPNRAGRLHRVICDHQSKRRNQSQPRLHAVALLPRCGLEIRSRPVRENPADARSRCGAAAHPQHGARVRGCRRLRHRGSSTPLGPSCGRCVADRCHCRGELFVGWRRLRLRGWSRYWSWTRPLHSRRVLLANGGGNRVAAGAGRARAFLRRAHFRVGVGFPAGPK